MQIISDFTKDTQSKKTKPGSYEWWYFDACSDDGYSLVIIFYDGNPFSRRYIKQLDKGGKVYPSQFPAISISVYKDAKPLFYSFEEFDQEFADFSETNPEGSVGENRFEFFKNGSHIEYMIDLNQKMDNGDSIQTMLKFRSTEKKISNLKNELLEQSDHTWNLLMPKCRVDGEIVIKGHHHEKINFRGTGYHDHNTGEEPMKESFHEWYWGRYHTSEATIIYYLMRKNNGWDNKAWLIEDDGNVKELQHFKLLDKGYNLFGLHTARSLQIKNENIDVFIQLDRLLDNGPFYQRFSGKLLLKTNGVIQQSRGISEYICPSKIYNKIFWPLINMRIKYPGESHWVQKNPILYRWTW